MRRGHEAVLIGARWFVRWLGPPSRPGASGIWHWGPWGSEWAARRLAVIMAARHRYEDE